MKRADFIKSLGLASVALSLPIPARVLAAKEQKAACVLIPRETAGPFPLDLSANTAFYRQDVRESKAGVQMNLKMKITGDDNCAAMPNLRVNIWHCDKDGLYSGYDEVYNPGQAGKTYMRGYQLTDNNGEVEFITILPGWYPGRVCHIHFQVYVSSSYAAVSQLTFDHTTKNAIYAANPGIYSKGKDPLTISKDNIFSDGYTYQLASLTKNSATGGYDAYLEVTVKGGSTVGIGNAEKETATHMSLGQNFPNPFTSETTVPVKLTTASQLKLELWDIQGRKVATIDKGRVDPDIHNITVNPIALGLSHANYAYQVHITNRSGTYTSCKLMIAAK